MRVVLLTHITRPVVQRGSSFTAGLLTVSPVSSARVGSVVIPSSFRQVTVSVAPVTGSPRLLWNPWTAAVVTGPYVPVGASSNQPIWASLAWSSRTWSLRAPRLISTGAGGVLGAADRAGAAVVADADTDGRADGVAAGAGAELETGGGGRTGAGAGGGFETAPVADGVPPTPEPAPADRRSLACAVHPVVTASTATAASTPRTVAARRVPRRGPWRVPRRVLTRTTLLRSMPVPLCPPAACAAPPEVIPPCPVAQSPA
ncbi:hypothetical protein GCM10010232_42020 [Streptomyces amakusaensis]